MASITFNDGTSATLDNGLTLVGGAVGSRFRGWVPRTIPVGPTATALGTGARTAFVFRTDYGASFTMDEIPNTSLSVALRLQRHMLAGGVITITTGDASSRVYTNVCVAPGGDVRIELTNAAELLYSMTFDVINLSGAAMLCEYPST